MLQIYIKVEDFEESRQDTSLVLIDEYKIWRIKQLGFDIKVDEYINIDTKFKQTKKIIPI